MAIAPTTSPRSRGHGRAGEDADFRRQAQHLHGVAGDVGGEAEEHGVPERQQADIADQQVEGAGEQREAQHLHQEHGIDDERRHQPERHQGGEHLQSAVVAAVPWRLYFGVPNRPCGRSISTIAMMMKITVLEASG